MKYIVVIACFFIIPDKAVAALDSLSINLAIRNAIHQLYLLQGDTSTMIAPIQQKEPREYWAKNIHFLDYDTFTKLLHQSLLKSGIDTTYEVAIYSCARQNIIVGYHVNNYVEGEIACGSRLDSLPCADLRIRFIDDKVTQGSHSSEKSSLHYMYYGIGSLLLIGLLIYTRIQSSANGSEQFLDFSTDDILIGNSKFNKKASTIIVGSNTQATELTYYESRLLDCLVQNSPEVVSRDVLQDTVWEDEGLTLSRSLDVHISRLRKILQNDKSISIKNSRGIGYSIITTKSASF